MSAKNHLERRVAVLRDLEGSGLSVAEFCRRRGLAYSTVMAWRCALRRRHPDGHGPTFIEVETLDLPPAPAPASAPASASASALCAELALPGGVVLRVYQNSGAGGVA